MKVKSILFIVAFLGAILFVSCTPESIENESTPQQVDATKIEAPNNG